MFVDVNECDDDNMFNCANDSTCMNTMGSYRCECDPGYYMEDDYCLGEFCSFVVISLCIGTYAVSAILISLSYAILISLSCAILELCYPDILELCYPDILELCYPDILELCYP